MILEWVEFAAKHRGLTLVFVGVIGEVIPMLAKWKWPFHSRRFDKAIEIAEFLFWAILVIGLALEFDESARSEREIAEAKNETANAVVVSTSTQERMKLVESTNVILRQNLAQVEMRAKARAVTVEQLTQFKALTVAVSKMPIPLFVGVTDGETESYLRNIRQLLDDSGFECQSNGVVRFNGMVYSRLRIAPLDSIGLMIVCGSSSVLPLRESGVGGVGIFNRNDRSKAGIVLRLSEILNSIGITNAADMGGTFTNILAPDQIGFFVPQKIF